MRRFLSRTIALLLLLGSQTHAATVAGVALPDTRGSLELHGAGLLRKGFFFKIYVGALYLEEPAHAERIMTDVPKRIDIHYFHKTPKGIMMRVAIKTLKKNLSKEQYAEMLPNLEKLHTAYLNGKKGSIASIIYEPGEGLTYAYDDASVITIECDEFANAYFSVWLGDEPSSSSVKKAMLEDLRDA
jgi:hypothetical protein